ncbi:hypothetical protein [Streptomyces sp. YU58]|uniref:hypothetical protein n=1 Tax=Streptomyces sp. SX92 TaxID=3158972 RepID=UPI0027BA96F2|nr:hypothetical protein [Streptomyces coralus]WLW54705.1 hypothetical protein QU709_26680 [Streptomyces coralus]
MVVDEAVAATLRGQSQVQVAIFVASCAERMTQVFTGLSGGDPARDGDTDVVIRLVEDLWDPVLSPTSFREYVTSLEGFQELEPSDEEIVDVAGIYSFYSVLVLRYAALYRVSGDVEDALKCAHASLTSMGQLDRNLPGVEFFAQEAECQQNAASIPSSNNRDSGLFLSLRESDRNVSRERLAAVQSRLGG